MPIAHCYLCADVCLVLTHVLLLFACTFELTCLFRTRISLGREITGRNSANIALTDLSGSEAWEQTHDCIKTYTHYMDSSFWEKKRDATRPKATHPIKLIAQSGRLQPYSPANMSATEQPKGVFPQTQREAEKHKRRPSDKPAVLVPKPPQQEAEEQEPCLPVFLRILNYDQGHRKMYATKYQQRYDAVQRPKKAKARTEEAAYLRSQYVLRRQRDELQVYSETDADVRFFESEMRKNLGRIYWYSGLRDEMRSSFWEYALGKAREHIRDCEERRVEYGVGEKAREDGRRQDRYFREVWLREKMDEVWPKYQRRLLDTIPRYLDGYPVQEDALRCLDEEERRRAAARRYAASRGRVQCLRCAVGGMRCSEPPVAAYRSDEGGKSEEEGEEEEPLACRSCVLSGVRHECIVATDWDPETEEATEWILAEPRREILPRLSPAYVEEIEEIWDKYTWSDSAPMADMIGGRVRPVEFVLPRRPSWYDLRLRAVGVEDEQEPEQTRQFEDEVNGHGAEEPREIDEFRQEPESLQDPETAEQSETEEELDDVWHLEYLRHTVDHRQQLKESREFEASLFLEEPEPPQGNRRVTDSQMLGMLAKLADDL